MKNLIITALTGLSLLACADKKTKPESNLPQSTKDKNRKQKERKLKKFCFSVKRDYQQLPVY
ncbi:hypothetical protein NV63_03580 [Elizabethkingia anophelis]|nr:hypothetical protein NV63_03580 [Elizabethkingia anophelis]